MILFLTIILVAGFVFCKTDISTFYKIHRYQGQYLYFQSALYGLLFFVGGFFLNALIYFAVFSFNQKIAGCYLYGFACVSERIVSNFFYSVWFVNPTILTIPLSYISAIALNKIGMANKTKNEYRFEVLHEDAVESSPFDRLILESLNNNLLLMLSMSDRKVYVGVVQSAPPPNERNAANQEILIAPAMSGQRMDDLSVEFSVNYKNGTLPDDGNSGQLPSPKNMIILALKRENILSATVFDLELYYERFQSSTKLQVEE